MVQPWQDSSFAFGERVRDLLGRMTLKEKISQMMHESPAVPRLGIPSYNWWNECLHGVGRAGKATVFPQAIGLAASFDPDLVLRIASAISDEARAKHHEALRNGNRDQYMGLTFWTPNINIFRDPRWGRGQETWGEDPVLTAVLGSAMVRGLQGDHPKYLKTAACAKHFAVHSGPEKDRHRFDARVSPKDLNETYLPAFKALVDAGVESVMGAYNRTNGEACCASETLLKKTLREEWGFQGHVVSDCGAIDDIHRDHKVTSTPEGSAALSVKSGCDLNCGCTYAYLESAVGQGLLTESDIDTALGRLLMTRFKLGMFDPPEKVPYSSVPVSAVDSEAHRMLAREAAVKSCVLLKNQGDLLPLGKGVKSLFVTGPTAASLEVLWANYFGFNPRMTTILEGLIGAIPAGVKVEYLSKCPLVGKYDPKSDWSRELSRVSDVTIAVVGNSPLLEGEEGDAVLSEANGDRIKIGLQENQVALLRHLKESGKPLVVVVTGGSAIAMPEVQELADAILFVWYPGEEGGNAVGDILFGRANPSGRLPVSFPNSVEDLPAFEDYSMRQRTYRYFRARPLYPFGFGLGYSKVDYVAVVPSKREIRRDESLGLEVRLRHVSGPACEDVVQIYVSHPDVPDAPIHSLKTWRRVALAAGDDKTVRFELGPSALGIIGDDGRPCFPKGTIRIHIGGSSPDRRSIDLGSSHPVACDIISL
jgi:beta-glucosidase